eukprot:jgi/Ulvmu1/2249/UM013_0096.1
MRNVNTGLKGGSGHEQAALLAAEELFALPASRHPALTAPCPQDIVLGSEWPFPLPREISSVSRDDVQLVECIGRGSYGTVFTAWVLGHTLGGLDDTWAIKVAGMHEDPWEGVRAGVRFSHEAFCLWRAGAAGRLARRGRGNVVGIAGCVTAPPHECAGVPFGLILEHCRGGDLFDVLSMSPTLADPQHFFPSGRIDSRARVGEQVCAAVAAFAAAGLVHNDIKPENLFLRRAGIPAVDDVAWPDDIALGDAGAARAVAQPLRGGRGMIVGTLPYTAPEIAAAAAAADSGCVAAAPAADVYSAGITLLLLIVKKFPWQLPDADVSRWAVEGRVVDHLARHAVPSDPVFINVLLWMTDALPEARPPAAVCCSIFMWLQEDLWAHGRLCLRRLHACWDMPRHPKLGLFPATTEPVVGPQHSKVPVDGPVLRDVGPSMHSMASTPSARLRSLSWEWPEVLAIPGACCPPVRPAAPGQTCSRSRTRSNAHTCMDDSCRSQQPFSSPFMDGPHDGPCRRTPGRVESSSLVPVFKRLTRGDEDPAAVLRRNCEVTLSQAMRDAHFVPTPTLSRRPAMLASASVSSGPLTSLHQAFPSCCGPPSVQASVMSRAGDALPEVEESPRPEGQAGTSYCRPACRDAAQPSCTASEDQPSAALSRSSAGQQSGHAAQPAQAAWQCDLSDDLCGTFGCEMLGCCEATCGVGDMLGTLGALSDDSECRHMRQSTKRSTYWGRLTRAAVVSGGGL